MGVLIRGVAPAGAIKQAVCPGSHLFSVHIFFRWLNAALSGRELVPDPSVMAGISQSQFKEGFGMFTTSHRSQR